MLELGREKIFLEITARFDRDSEANLIARPFHFQCAGAGTYDRMERRTFEAIREFAIMAFNFLSWALANRSTYGISLFHTLRSIGKAWLVFFLSTFGLAVNVA